MKKIKLIYLLLTLVLTKSYGQGIQTVSLATSYSWQSFDESNGDWPLANNIEHGAYNSANQRWDNNLTAHSQTSWSLVSNKTGAVAPNSPCAGLNAISINPAGSNPSYPNGQLIWASSYYTNQTVLFRTHIPAMARPFVLTSINLYANADDTAWININGHSVGHVVNNHSATSQAVTLIMTRNDIQNILYGDGGDVVSIVATNTRDSCASVSMSLNINYTQTTAPCSGSAFSCLSSPVGCTPYSPNSAEISNAERIGQLKSGDFGNGWTTGSQGAPNVWSALGSADIGGAPNTSNLYGLSISNNSDKAFFGSRNNGTDLTDAVIAWGDNSDANPNPDGSVDKLIFEFHGATNGACGNSTRSEIARMLPNGNVGIGFTNPSEKLTVGGSVLVDAKEENTGTFDKALKFGSFNSGEAIGSQRSTTGNFFGLDFYTDYGKRMSITNSGNVGIGTSTPRGQLEVSNTNKNNFASVSIFYDAQSATGSAMGTYSEAVSKDNQFNIGGDFEASNAQNSNYGLFADAAGGQFATGAYFTAQNAPFCVGVYASSSAPSGANNPNNCAGYFDGDIGTSSNFWITSDEKLKTNVKKFENGLDQLKKLEPKTYDFKNEEFQNSMNLPVGNQIGIMAQNIQSVFPNLVKEKMAPGHLDTKTHKKLGEDTKFLAVNYIGLIPVLVEATKELDAKTEENAKLKAALDNTNATVAALQQQINDICSGGCVGLKGSSTDAAGTSNALLQNVPNPFSQSTTIGYVLNSGTAAYMNINGLDGKTIKHIELTTKGQGSVTINANELNAGTYTYSMYVDGKVIDTKIMVITADK
jgi:hypothetical protein